MLCTTAIDYVSHMGLQHECSFVLANIEADPKQQGAYDIVGLSNRNDGNTNLAYLALLWKALEQWHTCAVLQPLKQAWSAELACQQWRLREGTLCCLAVPRSEHDQGPALQTQLLLEYWRTFAAKTALKQL